MHTFLWSTEENIWTFGDTYCNEIINYNLHIPLLLLAKTAFLTILEENNYRSQCNLNFEKVKPFRFYITGVKILISSLPKIIFIQKILAGASKECYYFREEHLINLAAYIAWKPLKYLVTRGITKRLLNLTDTQLLLFVLTVL